MNIVCIAAHQDDIELHCLGTMLKYAKLGHRITHLVLTNGDKGGQFDPSLTYEEVARVREKEAGAMASAFGARYICLGREDEYLLALDKTLLDDVIEVLRESRADVVFSAPPADYCLDHNATSNAAFQATVMSAYKTIYTKSPPLDAYPAFYFMEPLCGLGFVPTHYVDISDVFEEKCRLLRYHDSQMKNMTSSSGWDLVKYVNILGAFRGLQCGTAYAESFAVSQSFPRITAINNILP